MLLKSKIRSRSLDWGDELQKDVPLGQIIVVLDGKKDEIDKAISYIKSKNVKVFDINNGGKII